MLYFLIVGLRSQFIQPLLYVVVFDRLDKGALALTERDRYPSSRLQLCRFRKAPRAVLYGLVLLSCCVHITPILMRSQIMTWLTRLTRHTTMYIYIYRWFVFTFGHCLLNECVIVIVSILYYLRTLV